MWSWDQVVNLDYSDGPGSSQGSLQEEGRRVRVRQGDVPQKQRETWEDAAPLGEDGGCAVSQGQRAAAGSQRRQGNGFSPRVALSTHFSLLTPQLQEHRLVFQDTESVATCSSRRRKPIRLPVNFVKKKKNTSVNILFCISLIYVMFLIFRFSNKECIL